jgi:hypothetical protein
MSIPLDRLYHYIRDVAEKVYNGDILIYHFYPHGSKNIDDLIQLPGEYSYFKLWTTPQIYCYDQEPLNYNYYQDGIDARAVGGVIPHLYQSGKLPVAVQNLRADPWNIYDKCILLHSEQNSVNVCQYRHSHFIPVYYWAHACIALDWFRYAKYVTIQPAAVQKQFLIYNRAWAGTREYRLKFVELLQQHNLVDDCCTSFNPVDPEHNIHYTDHAFKNPKLRPTGIQDIFPVNSADSSASADFTIDDYAKTRFEVVLETLFDDDRIQLTEKILRPIACGHPFILASTPGCLKYLHRYGFKTFNGIIDESYDTEPDPVARLSLIVSAMVKITKWSNAEKLRNHIKIKEITEFNKQHFFNNNFFDTVTNELKYNLQSALAELEDTNTCRTYIEDRKAFGKLSDLDLVEARDYWRENSTDVKDVLTTARRYYNRYLKSLIE